MAHAKCPSIYSYYNLHISHQIYTRPASQHIHCTSGPQTADPRMLKQPARADQPAFQVRRYWKPQQGSEAWHWGLSLWSRLHQSHKSTPHHSTHEHFLFRSLKAIFLFPRPVFPWTRDKLQIPFGSGPSSDGFLHSRRHWPGGEYAFMGEILRHDTRSKPKNNHHKNKNKIPKVQVSSCG